MSMPDYRAVAVAAAKKNGIDPNLFVRQINQESGFNPKARSGAGAIGIAQIVPRWHPGVDPNDPVASLNYAAHLMGTLYRKYGDYEQALSVYNSGQPDAYKDPSFGGGETANYVKSIIGGKTPPVPAGKIAVPGLTPAAPFAPAAPTSPLTGMTALVKNSLQAGNKMLGLPNIPLPAFQMPSARVPALPVGMASPPLLPKSSGKVVLASGADRAGVTIKPAVLNFVSSVAALYGKPLTIGTGTNHNQYVAGSHRESDHWTGWAADVPASGAALTKLGQDALIAAGANPSWARKQKGGLFNVGGKQIIFNSMEGGNHFNHLHVGLRSH
jgi:hypothetical protein